MPKEAFDPAACGAQCHRCPLREERAGGPVPPEKKSSARALLIGQEPSANEVAQRRPFAGGAGRELDRALDRAGLRRRDLNLDNAICCQPPGKGGLAAYQAVRRAHNAAEKKRWMAACKAAQERLKSTPIWKTLKPYERSALVLAEVPPPQYKADPVECCAPRLLRAAAEAPGGNVFIAGAVAYHQMLPEDGRTFDQIAGGYTLREDGGKWFVGYNPAAVCHKRYLFPVFVRQLAKSFRLFAGKLNWPSDEELWKRVKVNPTLEWLEALLFGSAGAGIARWSFDWETTWDPPNDDVLLVEPKSLGIGYRVPLAGGGAEWRAVVIERIDVSTGEVIPGSYWNAAMRLVRRAFSDDREWWGQNSGMFDATVARMHKPLGRAPKNHRDILLHHRELFPQLRHNLALQSQTWLDVNSYKSDDSGEGMAGTRDRRAFQLYNATDCITTGMLADLYTYGDPAMEVVSTEVDLDYARPMPIGVLPPRAGAPPPAEGVAQSREGVDRWAQQFCTELHHIGIWLHEPTRRRMEHWFKCLRYRLRHHEIHPRSALYGFPKLNPSSIPQMRELLYDKLCIKHDPFEDTEQGSRGTGSATLRRVILGDAREFERTPPNAKALREIQDLLAAIYKERRVSGKALGTYCLPFAGPNAKRSHSEDEVDEAEEDDFPDYFWADGRIRAEWKMDSIVNRLKCKRPGLQTLPGYAKFQFQPEPGHFYFGADMSQIHPRLASIYWGLGRLKEAFIRGEDCYSVIAHIIFGAAWEKCCPRTGDGRIDFTKKPKKGTQASRMRDRAKTHFLATLYGASVKVRLEVLRKTEDEYGNLAMKDLTEAAIEAMDDALFKGLPELRAGWARTIAEAERNGRMTGTTPWLAEPLGGRRRAFYNGLDANSPGNDINDCLNYPILGAESVIIHTLAQRVRERWPLHFDGPGTGIIIQVHDQLGLEAKFRDEAHAKRCAEELRDILSSYSLEGVPFPPEESWGFDLSCA